MLLVPHSSTEMDSGQPVSIITLAEAFEGWSVFT